MTTYLFDAWALLAYLKQEEPASDRIVDLLQQAFLGKVHLFISIVNLGEVYYRAGKERGLSMADELLEGIYKLPIQVLPVDDALVLSAARWKMQHPISYADAFAAATAHQKNAILLTGDPELLAIANILAIEPLRRSR